MRIRIPASLICEGYQARSLHWRQADGSLEWALPEDFEIPLAPFFKGGNRKGRRNDARVEVDRWTPWTRWTSGQARWTWWTIVDGFVA